MEIILSIVVFGLLFYIFALKKNIREVTDGIDKIFDEGRKSEEILYDESMLSKLEVKAVSFVRDNLDEKRKLELERDAIKSLIGDISHQTKTPISNISIYTELLEGKYEDEYIDILKYEVDKLSFLIDSLVKASQLEANLIQLNISEVNVEELLERIIRSSGEWERVHLTMDTGFKVLDIDAKWTEEAIYNILDNAVKYSYPNTDIDIVVSDTVNYMKIDIISTGDRIPAENYNELFKRFYRGENSHNKDGFGIGLFLSREIVELQSGYITVDSRDRNVFSVFLPLLMVLL